MRVHRTDRADATAATGKEGGEVDIPPVRNEYVPRLQSFGETFRLRHVRRLALADDHDRRQEAFDVDARVAFFEVFIATRIMPRGIAKEAAFFCLVCDLEESNMGC